MNKKGFTLIEVIICISLLAVIGVGSFFGIKMVDNKIRIDKLSQITDRAIEAAQIYIETDKEASKQLYRNSNGVSVPLQLLVNKGLLNIDNTDLTLDDLKDEYVVTFLGGSGGSENCEQITSTASWANDKPLYLCMKSDGSSNLATIDPNLYGNLTTVTKEPYYFKGDGVKNWVKYNNVKYRIISVESDDSLVLYHSESFGSTFNGLTNPISKMSISTCFLSCPVANQSPNLTGKQGKYLYGSSYTEITGESGIDCNDVVKTSICTNVDSCVYGTEDNCPVQGWMKASIDYKHYNGATSSQYNVPIISLPTDAKKIHLKPCMKITSGTGDFATPYILEAKNC